MSAVSKNKVDEVWEEYESLTVPEQERLFEMIIQNQQRPGKISFYVYSFQTSDKNESEVKNSFKSVSEKIARRVSKNKQTKKPHKTSIFYKFQNKLIQVEQNNFLKKPEQFWQLISLFGEEHIAKKLNEKRHLKFIINTQFIYSIFKESTLNFYVDKTGQFLFSNRNELYETDFGQLTELTGLEALKQFGLENLENAKEKGYIKI